jgi:tetratricopeptide (TPR) repeat protein
MRERTSRMTMKRAVGAAVVGAAMAALCARPAAAATKAEQAEALIHEGVELRAHDQTARALTVFEKAYQLSRSPRTAAQLGLCELELAKYVDAQRHLLEALASPDHPWIAKNKSILMRQLATAAANVGELALTVSPSGADVLLDGKPIDRSLAGAAIPLEKGTVEVEVRAPGYQPARERITIRGGQREQRTYLLLPETPVGPAVAMPIEAPPPASGAAVDLTATPPPAGQAARNERLAAWITGGAALGALALGTLEAFNAASKRDAFNSHTAVQGGVVVQDCGTAALDAACKPLKDSYDTALTLSVVGFVSAAALGAASAVLFRLSSGHAGTPESSSVARSFACVPEPGVRGVGCALRF